MCVSAESQYPLGASLAAVREAIETSEFIQSIARAKEAFNDPCYRNLVWLGFHSVHSLWPCFSQNVLAVRNVDPK